MKKTIIFGTIGIVLLLLLFNYIMPSYLRNQEQQIQNLEITINELKAETNPIIFKIIEKRDNKIIYKVLFLDEDNNKISSFEDEIVGNELFFDFFSVKVGNKYIAFPDKIFSDAVASSEGKDLKLLYDKKGFPMVFYSEKLSSDAKKALSDLFTKIKNPEEEIKEQFGTAVHDLSGVNSFVPGYNYKIIAHTKGGIEIITE